MTAFDDMADELYLLAPAEFVAVRTDLAAQVKAAGDPATAAEIAKLRKPTVTAWLINVLAATEPDLIAGAVAIGPALREATEVRDGAAIRDLSGHRRALLGQLVQRAREIAAEHEQAFTPTHEREIESSFTAAMSDDAAAAAVASRRLTGPVEIDDLGFGGGMTASAPAARPAAKKDASAADKEAEERARAIEAAEHRLAEARLQEADADAALEEAEQALADAVEAEQEAAAALRAAKEALSDARADRTAAAADATATRTAVETALADLEHLRRS